MRMNTFLLKNSVVLADRTEDMQYRTWFQPTTRTNMEDGGVGIRKSQNLLSKIFSQTLPVRKLHCI